MWGAADAFHMSWIRLSGDVTLTADVRLSRRGRRDSAEESCAHRTAEPRSGFCVR